MPVRLACLFALVCAASAVDLPNKIEGMETTYEMLEEGAGKSVGKADTVTVHATGIVKDTGKKFWSTKDAGQQPFTYQAGVNKVIKGWDQGCLGMKVGGKRKLDIPAAEGYGAGEPSCCPARLAHHCYIRNRPRIAVISTIEAKARVIALRDTPQVASLRGESPRTGACCSKSKF